MNLCEGNKNVTIALLGILGEEFLKGQRIKGAVRLTDDISAVVIGNEAALVGIHYPAGIQVIGYAVIGKYQVFVDHNGRFICGVGNSPLIYGAIILFGKHTDAAVEISDHKAVAICVEDIIIRVGQLASQKTVAVVLCAAVIIAAIGKVEGIGIDSVGNKGIVEAVIHLQQTDALPCCQAHKAEVCNVLAALFDLIGGEIYRTALDMSHTGEAQALNGADVGLVCAADIAGVKINTAILVRLSANGFKAVKLIPIDEYGAIVIYPQGIAGRSVLVGTALYVAERLKLQGVQVKEAQLSVNKFKDAVLIMCLGAEWVEKQICVGVFK